MRQLIIAAHGHDEAIDPIAEYLAADYDTGKDDCASVGIPTIKDFVHEVTGLKAKLVSKTFGHVQLVRRVNSAMVSHLLFLQAHGLALIGALRVDNHGSIRLEDSSGNVRVACYTADLNDEAKMV